MSFDLDVLAIDPDATDDDVRAMVRRCNDPFTHPEGELDGRIVGFYEDLRARFPDSPPYDDSDQSPWSSAPLSLGIDHVQMCLRFGEISHPAIELINELATRYGLIIHDPQFSQILRPGSTGATGAGGCA